MNINRSYQIKILIVDDDPDDHYTYERMLRKVQGVEWTILKAETGREGLELCKIEKPDCILLDYILPDIDGLEFLLQTKSMSVSTPVIMLTGQGDETVAVLAIKEGASNYLVKSSLTPASLKQAILNSVEQNNSMGSENATPDADSESSRPNWNKKKKVELISEIQTLTEKLQSFSGIDPVTGLPNRRNMLDKLHHEKCRFDRNGSCFSLIMADIDNFDSMRDTCDSETTNRVLAQVGRLLDLNSRAQDVVGHWARERFFFLLPDTDLEGATVLMEKLCKKVETAKFPGADGENPITMSFRAGVYNDETMEIEDCIEQADKCLM